MASVSPLTPAEHDTTIGSRMHSVRTGVLASTGEFTANGQTVYTQGLLLRFFHFSSIDDADTWDSGSATPPPKNLVAVAWQGDDVDDDLACCYITDRGGIGDHASVEFQTSGAGKTGWVWCLIRQ